MPPGAPPGVWNFVLRGDQLNGGLTLADGTRMRRVSVTRETPRDRARG